MTLDSALLYRPTESLVLPTHRKFFPFRIPNTHHQLRHYISTADPDRIYAAVGRIIYSIHVSSRKREIITIVPFDPKCLTASYGWIGVGGTENGDCAFIKLGDSSPHPLSSTAAATASTRTDVDTPLPIDINPPLSRRALPCPPEVSVQEFGGSIVNSITIHRLPADGDLFSHEDIAILSNNDMTVSIFSLTRMEMIETIRHQTCMNYAIISPDSKILAAVGDENRIYFYRVTPCPESRVPIANGGTILREWSWPFIKSVELDSDIPFDDRCCFTIAFSPSSHLCAVGSQAGIITVFDVETILGMDTNDTNGREAVLCVFRSSRSSFDGGAVRCMSFSPHPWDLLVWVEDHGRVGVADVRQAFSRRQILILDSDAPGVERIRTENIDKMNDEDSEDSELENTAPHSSGEPSDAPEDLDTFSRAADAFGRRPRRRRAQVGDSSRTMRESLTRDLTARERQIIDFLNTARWASSIEEGPQRLTRLLSPMPYSASPTAAQPGNHSPLSSPPPDQSSSLHESVRDRNTERPRVGQPRRRSSIVLSQDNPTPPGPSAHPNSSALIPHPTVSLRLSQSPFPILSNDPSSETTAPNNGGSRRITSNMDNGQASSSSSSIRGRGPAHRTRVLLDRSLGVGDNNNTGGQQRQQRTPRSRSIPRPSDRLDTTNERQDSRGSLNSDFRSTLATERLRLQRQAALEESQRLNEWEQQYRRLLEFDHVQSNPRFRNLPGDLSDRNVHSSRDQGWGVGTAGIGWGVDSQTLYIGTVQGILEYRINVQDRKTFPGFACR